MDMTNKAPSPISRPDEYFLWLSRVCSVYNCLIPDVKQLLILTYGSEWLLCEAEFKFPDSDNGGQWPTTTTMEAWLTDIAKAAIAACAQNRNDFSKVIQCVQENKVTVPAFIQRFITTWHSSAGLTRENNNLFAVQTLLQNLKPQITVIYKMSVPDWHTVTWKDTVNKMLGLHRADVFASCSSGVIPKLIVQQLPNEDKPKKGGGQHSNQPNYKQKRGNCRNCGKPGHWQAMEEKDQTNHLQFGFPLPQHKIQ